jgi:hypothetical protein
MKNLQIDIKIKIQINETTLELSKAEAELLYNTLGDALNKHVHPFCPPYTTTPWTGLPLPPCPTGVRSIESTCAIT